MNMKSNLEQLMSKAKEMQEKMQKAQKEIEQLVVIGMAGGGLVKIHMTGRHDAKKVEIDAAAMKDKEMLEDLIAAAINDANRRIEQETRGRVGNLTEGLNLPEGFME